MATSVLSMILETKKRGTGGADATRELQGVTKGLGQMLGLGSNVLTFAGTFFALRTAFRATVGAAMEYAGEVRQLSSITGQTAESSSRLIQVFDDFGVTGGQVTTMLRTLAAQGLSPTIETIAQLSDRYLALAPGVERATFLQQNFGRSGADLDLVMSQGSATLLARNAAVESGFVLNQQQLDQAEELRQAEDALGDAWEAFAITIGTRVIPVVTDLIQGLFDLGNAHIYAYGPHGQILYEINSALGALDEGVRDTAGGLDEGARAALGWGGAIRSIPTSHTTEIAATFAVQVLDDYARRLLDAGWWSFFGVGAGGVNVFRAGAGGQTVLSGGVGGGPVGAPGTVSAAAAWRAGAGYSPMSEAELLAAGYTRGQHGLSFDVGGPAGVDRVPVNLALTRGEHVDVTPAGERRSGGLTIGQLIVNTELDEQILLSKFRRLLT